MKCIVTIGLALTATLTVAATVERPVWPVPPDAPRVEFIEQIRCQDLALKTGFFGKVKRILGGKSENEDLGLPFDVLVSGRMLYMTCQNIPALVAVDLDERTFRLFDGGKHPMQYPIALAADDQGAVYVTDSEAGTVYRLMDGRLKPFITEGLIRPTGIAVLSEVQRLYVVDTGDHTVKMFDLSGTPLTTISTESGFETGLHYPTFAATDGTDGIVVNDALNYRIKRFGPDGGLHSAFGEEGDSPGTFARPKGVAVDSDNQVWVVDNLFDNVQVFDSDGRLLLVIGNAGQDAGQFWSPSGIDIVNDTVYIADTFNNRIQVLRYLGDGE